MNLGPARYGAEPRLRALPPPRRSLFPLTLEPSSGTLPGSESTSRFPLLIGVCAGGASRAARLQARRPGVAEMDPKKVTAWRQIALLSSIPFILALAPIVGYFLGKFLDQKFRTQPWLSIVLLALGFVAGVRETIKIIKLSQQED